MPRRKKPLDLSALEAFVPPDIPPTGNNGGSTIMQQSSGSAEVVGTRNENQIAVEINELNDQIITAARTSLEKAVRIGQLLREVKSGLKRGQWLSWLESNVRFDRRTATPRNQL
jgi:Protein of unknown function (DUF3102)